MIGSIATRNATPTSQSTLPPGCDASLFTLCPACLLPSAHDHRHHDGTAATRSPSRRPLMTGARVQGATTCARTARSTHLTRALCVSSAAPRAHPVRPPDLPKKDGAAPRAHPVRPPDPACPAADPRWGCQACPPWGWVDCWRPPSTYGTAERRHTQPPEWSGWGGGHALRRAARARRLTRR